MGKWCLHASSFIFDWIIIKVAGNQDRHKSTVELDFGPNQPTHFGVTCPWVTKISHFWTLISLKPVGQSWSNFMCSIIRVGERLHEVLGQIDFGKLDSGERVAFGLLVFVMSRLISVQIDGSTVLTQNRLLLIQNMKRLWLRGNGAICLIKSICEYKIFSYIPISFKHKQIKSIFYPLMPRAPIFF